MAPQTTDLPLEREQRRIACEPRTLDRIGFGVATFQVYALTEAQVRKMFRRWSHAQLARGRRSQA